MNGGFPFLQESGRGPFKFIGPTYLRFIYSSIILISIQRLRARVEN